MEFAQVLFELGADVDDWDCDKLTLLHIALKHGHMEITWLLVEHDSDIWIPLWFLFDAALQCYETGMNLIGNPLAGNLNVAILSTLSFPNSKLGS